mmetsp:Transcript_103156/g.280310  ORF Transcript_103156/g.280310 Transcript_103156/m.280310 type:complete len:517 (-) Transcript_103156:67-1617(-)
MQRVSKVGAQPGTASAAVAQGSQARGSAAVAFGTDDLGLSFYQNPPNVEVSVREFEELTRDRLKVLHVFDRACGYDTRLDAVGELKSKVSKELSETRLSLNYPKATAGDAFLEQKADFMRRDAISHYALRLAFCKTREARDWLVMQEQRLFVLRFEALRPEAQEACLPGFGLECKKVDPLAKTRGDKGNLLDFLQQATPGGRIWREAGAPPLLDPNFYEMHFTDVSPNLISSRRVVLQDGRAYVPSSALKVILAKKFKEALLAGLDMAFQGLPAALSDPRVGGFLQSLQDYGMQLLVGKAKPQEDVGEKLSMGNFEELLTRSFPPCMRRLVEEQRSRKKHLKHAGRLQLRPFLKQCGFSFEESVQWWRQELCRDSEVDGTSFEKNYLYDMEHAYGKKGHLQGQNAFACPKIITTFPAEAAGQVHGCPFKHCDMPVLKQQLHRWRVPESTVGEIEKLINHGKHYQLACIEHFKAQHPGHSGDGLGNAPGDYFRESCGFYRKKQEAESPSARGAQPAR